MKIKIMNDVYNIANRLKDIDKDYYVLYDTSKHCFELHNSTQIDTSYCLTFPYEFLDERSLNYTLKTKNTNIENIINEIDRENKIRENREKLHVLSNFDNALENELIKGG